MIVILHGVDGMVGESETELRKLAENLIAALKAARVVHESEMYHEPPYPERWDHTLRPGGRADADSRARTRKWLDKYVKP